jgi:predicted nucleotidyltransferase
MDLMKQENKFTHPERRVTCCTTGVGGMKDFHGDAATASFRRRPIPRAEIQRLADQIAELFKPFRIVLFGSYARDAQRPESDVDLLVLMDTPEEGEESLRIRQAVPCDFGLDLIVRTPESFRQRLLLGDFFLREIAEQGKVLYESPDRLVTVWKVRKIATDKHG